MLLSEQVKKPEIKVFLTWNKSLESILYASLSVIKQCFGEHELELRVETEGTSGTLWVEIYKSESPEKAYDCLQEFDKWFTTVTPCTPDGDSINFNIQYR